MQYIYTYIHIAANLILMTECVILYVDSHLGNYSKVQKQQIQILYINKLFENSINQFS